MYKFSKTSTARLEECHPDLQRLFNEVIKYIDCTIICGHRNEEEQNVAHAKGYSMVKYANSKHNSMPAHAVDVMQYPICWTDYRRTREFAKFVKVIAKKLDINILCGADFKSFFDGAHFELLGGE